MKAIVFFILIVPAVIIYPLEKMWGWVTRNDQYTLLEVISDL